LYNAGKIENYVAILLNYAEFSYAVDDFNLKETE